MASHYRIRWKGRTEGPYSREEIRTRLAGGELSLLHRIEVSGKWIGLGEFVASEESAPEPAPAATRHREARERTHAIHAPVQATGSGAKVFHAEPPPGVGYFLCGLCFMLPFAATLPAVAVALRIGRREDRRTGRVLLALAVSLTLLGVGFWIAAYFAYAKGMI